MSRPLLGRRESRTSGEPIPPRDPQDPSGTDEPPRGYGGGSIPEDSEKSLAEASPDGLKYIFEIAKNEVDTQFKIAERLDAKARGLFALAGAIFAAAQALALRKDVLDGLSSGDRDKVVTIAIVAGSVLGAALLATALAIFVRRESSVKPSHLVDWLNALAMQQKTDLTVSREAVMLYIDLAEERQKVNKRRIYVMWVVQVLCVVAIAVSAYELIVALGGLA